MQVTETLNEGLKHEFKINVPGIRSRRQGGRQAGRYEGQGPSQRLPSGQGAGRPSEEALWPLGDGRDHRPDHPRHQHADLHRARLPPRGRAEDHDADRAEGGRGTARGQDRSDLHGRDRSGAGDHSSPTSRAFSVEKPVADVTDTDVDEAIKRIADQPTAAMRRRPRAPRPSRATASPSTSRARINGEVVRGRHRRGHPGRDRLRPVHPGLRGAADRHRRRRDPHAEGVVPEELHEREARRPAGRVRDHGDRDRGAAEDRDRRRVRQDARPRIARQAEGSRARAAGGRVRRRDAPARQAHAARPPRRERISSRRRRRWSTKSSI